jgi:hypothetical protein
VAFGRHGRNDRRDYDGWQRAEGTADVIWTAAMVSGAPPLVAGGVVSDPSDPPQVETELLEPEAMAHPRPFGGNDPRWGGPLPPEAVRWAVASGIGWRSADIGEGRST